MSNNPWPSMGGSDCDSDSEAEARASGSEEEETEYGTATFEAAVGGDYDEDDDDVVAAVPKKVQTKKAAGSSALHGKGAALKTSKLWEESQKQLRTKASGDKKAAAKNAVAVAAPAPAAGLTIEQVAMIVQQMSASRIGMPMAASQAREVILTFSASTSLAELGKANEFKLFVGMPADELERKIGGTIQAKTMELLAYSNKFPCSWRLNADHFPGEKFTNHGMHTGFGMEMLSARATVQLPVPKTIYRGEASSFKTKLLEEYPGLKANDIGNNVMNMNRMGMGKSMVDSCLVRSDDVVMVGVNAELKELKEAAAKEGKPYSGPVPTKIQFNGGEAYQMSEALCKAGINWLVSMYNETEDTIDVKTGLYFTLHRAMVSQRALETKGSSSAVPDWCDDREIPSSLKDNHTVKTAIAKNHDVSITVRIVY